MDHALRRSRAAACEAGSSSTPGGMMPMLWPGIGAPRISGTKTDQSRRSRSRPSTCRMPGPTMTTGVVRASTPAPAWLPVLDAPWSAVMTTTVSGSALAIRPRMFRSSWASLFVARSEKGPKRCPAWSTPTRCIVERSGWCAVTWYPALSKWRLSTSCTASL